MGAGKSSKKKNKQPRGRVPSGGIIKCIKQMGQGTCLFTHPSLEIPPITQ